MTILRMLIFFLSVFFIYVTMNLFVYKSIASGLELRKKYKRLLLMPFFILSPLYILAELAKNQIDLPFIILLGALWIGILSISFSVFLIQLLIVFAIKSIKKKMTIISLLLILVLSCISVYRGLSFPVIKEIEIHSSKIPQTLSGFKIVHLTDLHLGKLKTIEWFGKIIEHINEFSPDIVVITGDLMDLDICNYDMYCEIAESINSKFGIFAVPGNHEYYAGIEFIKGMRDIERFNLLINESLPVNDYINIIGLDDPAGISFGYSGPDLTKALRNIKVEQFNILLVHQPVNLRRIAESDYGIDLILSGHTHMGQIPPMDLIVYFYYRYHYGLFRHKNTFIYTSSGTGTWGPPMRLFSRSEIVIINLYRSE